MQLILNRNCGVILAWHIILIVLLPALSCSPVKVTPDKIGIAVSIVPQAEFVESVSGGKTEITVMVPPGADPHTYEPLSSQMTRLSNAVMYVKLGSGLEFELAWLEKFNSINSKMLMVDCSKGIKLLNSSEDDDHGLSGHAKASTDPHIWLSPPNAVIMVKNICDGLVQVDPQNRLFYEANRESFLKQLFQMDKDMREGLAVVRDRSFMTFHPSFAYLAEAYNLTMITIAVDGKEPTAVGLARVIEQAKKKEVKIIFVSPQFNVQSASVIAGETGAKIIVVDTLAKDYIGTMRLILKSVTENMK